MNAEFDLAGGRQTAHVIKRNAQTVLVRVDNLRLAPRVEIIRRNSPAARKERATRSIFRAFMEELGVKVTRQMRGAKAVVVHNDRPKTKVIKRHIKKHNVRFT